MYATETVDRLASHPNSTTIFSRPSGRTSASSPPLSRPVRMSGSQNSGNDDRQCGGSDSHERSEEKGDRKGKWDGLHVSHPSESSGGATFVFGGVTFVGKPVQKQDGREADEG